MSYIYECRLEVPVWTADSDAERAEQYRPRLVFTRADYHTELLVQVSAWADDLPGRDRWVVQFYPPDQTGLPRQEDDGDYWKPRRWPRRQDPRLTQGELREPRDTAAAAIRRGLELVADFMPKGDHAAMEKVAEMLRPQLDQTMRAYLTRFRLARQAKPTSQ